VEATSPAGVIGALLGLIVGWVEYRIVGGAVERKLRDTDHSETAAEKADYERRIRIFRRILLVSTVGATLVAGYLLGRGIAG
jgi:hypothetical protein